MPKRETKRDKNLNLKPFKKGSERSKTLGKKGGKNTTKRKIIANSLRMRKWCKPDCKLFENCPFMELSQQHKERRCLLKKTDMKIQKRVMDILDEGSQGIINEIRRVLIRMGKMSDGTESLKATAIYADKLKDLRELIFGRKLKEEIKTDQKIEIIFKDPYRKKV